MEVEVKLRLDVNAYTKLLPLLHNAYPYLGTKHQTNHFFDSPERTLASTRTVFRIRRSLKENLLVAEAKNSAVTYTSTVKGKATLVDGICRVEESEDVIPSDIAEFIITNLMLDHSHKQYVPFILLSHDRYPTIERMLERIGSDLVRTGTFTNKRELFKMGALLIELDQTTVPLIM